jgi:hypothetical protein
MVTKEDFERLEIEFRGASSAKPSQEGIPGSHPKTPSQEDQPSQKEDSPTEDSPKYPFKCDQCKMSFASENKRTAHTKKVHEGPAKFNCELCEHKTYYKKEHTRHMEKEHKTQKKFDFVCEKCGESKQNKYRLDQHIDQFHPIPHPECPGCHKTFPTKPEMRNHKKSCGNDGQLTATKRQPKDSSGSQSNSSHVASTVQPSEGSAPEPAEGSTS